MKTMLVRIGGRGAAAFLLLLSMVMALPAGAQTSEAEYRLGAGDRVRVTVFGQPDLSDEFEVASNGTISMPLIGAVPTVGKSLPELEEQIAYQLRQGYLNQPSVSVEVLNYRPFYILGEVETPGSYPYRAGMTVLNAVVMGGGYTYRADQDDITVKRSDASGEREIEVTPDTKVLPGDVINVGMRFF